MEQKYTVTEVLTMVIDHLASIAVPRKLNEQIGIPIDEAIEHIRLCLNAINQKEAQTESNEPENNKGDENHDD